MCAQDKHQRPPSNSLWGSAKAAEAIRTEKCTWPLEACEPATAPPCLVASLDHGLILRKLLQMSKWSAQEALELQVLRGPQFPQLFAIIGHLHPSIFGR